MVQRGLSHGQVTGLYAGLAVVATAAALAGLAVDPLLRQALAVLAYVPMLAVVLLVWRLEANNPHSKQPNDAPTVVTQGHS